jgi:hypothetical protein
VVGSFSEIESEIGAIPTDRSLDEWVREQNVNKLRAERSDLRPQVQHLEKALSRGREIR